MTKFQHPPFYSNSSPVCYVINFNAQLSITAKKMHGKLRVVQLVILAQKLMARILRFKFINIMKRIFPFGAGKFRVKIQTFPGGSG
jgi:hypothetical protein